MEPSRIVRLLIAGVLYCAASFFGAGPSSAQDEEVDTPFGKVPRECYHQHPAGTTLSRIPNGVHAVHVDGTTKDYISSEKCLAFGRSFKGRRAAASGSSPISNGWFNYAGWVAPQTVGQFTATYTLPNVPANPGSQTLYYYIGIEDLDSSPLVILQPVIAYSQGASGGWSLTSWNCCASGQVNSGNTVTGMAAGDTIQASIMQISQSPSTYAIDGTWNGSTASLNVVVGAEAFNWPNVTLEIKNVTTCDQFATGPFTFSQLYLASSTYMTLQPNWGVEPSGGTTACNGQLTQNGPTITIQQNLTSGQRAR